MARHPTNGENPMSRNASSRLSVAAMITFAAILAGMMAGGNATAADDAAKGAPIYSIPVAKMKADGGGDTTATLAPMKGEVMLIVNVASKCGNTPQYKDLEAMNRKYAPRGLRVIGFPCNDFGGQEPGTEEEIVKFCRTNYDVTFPLYAKLHTKGPEQSPLYKYLTEGVEGMTGEVKWNFEKFLVGRDGKVVARFPSKVKPDSPELVAAVEKELAKSGN
jgi:glutathione peroxidase